MTPAEGWKLVERKTWIPTYCKCCVGAYATIRLSPDPGCKACMGTGTVMVERKEGASK